MQFKKEFFWIFPNVIIRSLLAIYSKIKIVFILKKKISLCHINVKVFRLLYVYYLLIYKHMCVMYLIYYSLEYEIRFNRHFSFGYNFGSKKCCVHYICIIYIFYTHTVHVCINLHGCVNFFFLIWGRSARTNIEFSFRFFIFIWKCCRLNNTLKFDYKFFKTIMPQSARR